MSLPWPNHWSITLSTGETLRFTGPAGAPFVVTVGAVFEAEYVQKMVDSGEWTPVVATPKAAPKSAARTRKAG